MLNRISKISKKALSFQLASIFSRSIITDPQIKKLIPEEPEKSLFSTLISEALSEEESKKLENELAVKVNPKWRQDELRPYKKSENFELQRTDYRNIIKEFPHGKSIWVLS
jgi:hypothetical protein